MIQRIIQDLEGEGQYDLTLETAQKMISFMGSDLGKLILRHMDREEFLKYEEDVGERVYDKTLFNKGYIQGIRAVRSLFQQAVQVEREERERVEQQREH